MYHFADAPTNARHELQRLADAAEALARELTAKINETFPVAEEPGDAADTLYIEADLAAGAVWHLAGLIRRTARKI